MKTGLGILSSVLSKSSILPISYPRSQCSPPGHSFSIEGCAPGATKEWWTDGSVISWSIAMMWTESAYGVESSIYL